MLPGLKLGTRHFIQKHSGGSQNKQQLIFLVINRIIVTKHTGLASWKLIFFGYSLPCKRLTTIFLFISQRYMLWYMIWYIC